MDHPVTFARHFARLVWLLVHELSNTDEQKASLRALVTVSKDGAVTLAARDEQLAANGATVSTAFAGVPDVVDQMIAHSLRAIEVDAGAGPADLLGAARILAGTPVIGDGGVAAEGKRTALGATTVRFTVRPPPGALPDFGLGDMVDEPVAAVPRRARLSAADVAPRSDGGTGGMFDQFGPPRAPSGNAPALLDQLDASNDLDALTRLLDDLVLLAEHGARDGKPTLVTEILRRIVRREAQLAEPETKRAFVMGLRRLAKPLLLQVVATQLPRAPEQRDELMAVLARAGEDGADALVAQIAAVAQQTDRRVYFDALLQLQAGVPTLLHMLGDARWFVARNAADLLGEMQAREGEQPLTDLLRHADDRVRRSATTALMRLGTPRAMQAIQDALRDGAPQMRMQAAAALVSRQDVRTAATLVRALDEEKDEEVQAAFLFALGKLGTPDAVQRLLKAAEPERGLFRKRATSFRVAAVQGLAEARTPETLELLRTLQHDKEEDVRDAATFALGRIARLPTAP